MGGVTGEDLGAVEIETVVAEEDQEAEVTATRQERKEGRRAVDSLADAYFSFFS